MSRSLSSGRASRGPGGLSVLRSRPSVRSDIALERNVTAIDQKIARGDEGSLVGSEIERTGGDLLGLPRAIEEVPRTVANTRLLLAAGSGAGTFRQDEPRRDRVGPDLVGGVIHRQDAREMHQGRLRG